MNCLECQELIQRCLDGEPAALDWDDFATHLVICSDCRDQYAAAQCLLDGLRLLPPSRPPADLLERICRQVVVERVRAAQFRQLPIASAVAASFLLTCWAVYTVSRSVPIADAPAELSQVQQPRAPTDSPSLHRSIQEAGLAVVALTRRTADETMDQTKLFLPVTIPQASVGDAEDLEQALQAPAQSFREIQEAMSAGLEPVATSARRAVGLFLREIPPMENSLQ
jgi:hypothetical protein